MRYKINLELNFGHTCSEIFTIDILFMMPHLVAFRPHMTSLLKVYEARAWGWKVARG